VNRLAIVFPSSMCKTRSRRVCVHASTAALRLLLTGEEDMDMTTLLIIILVVLVLGGGGWGYSRWRG